MFLLTLTALAVLALFAPTYFWLLSERCYYWRHPIAWVFDDAMVQGMDMPTEALLSPLPNSDFSWQGQRRQAEQLRLHYGVRKLSGRQRSALM